MKYACTTARSPAGRCSTSSTGRPPRAAWPPPRRRMPSPRRSHRTPSTSPGPTPALRNRDSESTEARTAPTWTQIATVGAGVTTYLASGLSPDATYQFRVRAYNAPGASSFSNVVSATTPDQWLIAEDFSDGVGGLSAVDGPWALSQGSYGVTADNTAGTTHLNSRSVHDTVVTGDFVLSVDATALAARDPWSNFAVIFGYQDASNYYFFSSNQSNDSATSGLFRVVNGVSTELADVAQGITPGVTYRLRLERAGSEIRAYRDDALVAPPPTARSPPAGSGWARGSSRRASTTCWSAAPRCRRRPSRRRPRRACRRRRRRPRASTCPGPTAARTRAGSRSSAAATG